MRLAREREAGAHCLDLELLGYHPEQLLFRPPFSAYDERLVAYLGHTHRRLVLWGIDSGDWQGLDGDTIVNNVVNRVHPGSIIIFHDSDEKDKADRRPTVEALKLILPALQAKGYRLVTISQLVAGESLEPAQSKPSPLRRSSRTSLAGARSFPAAYDGRRLMPALSPRLLPIYHPPPQTVPVYSGTLGNCRRPHCHDRVDELR